MAKSRGRKFAELIAPSNGIFDAASLPTIPAEKVPTISISKLENSTFSVNSESASLGGNITLDTGDITEHTSAKYFTDTRADARIAAHNLLARAGGTMTGNLTLGDNVNAYFGASTDLRIYHDGTNSHIINSTGELRFTGSNFAFKSDSAKLYFGLSDDLQIYHDGSSSYIKDAGTGSLRILATDLHLRNSADNGYLAHFDDGGAVTLYHNGSAKLATGATGVTVTGVIAPTSHLQMNHADNQYIYLGAGNDLQIYHDGTHSYMANTGGSLYIRSTNSIQLETNGGVDMLTLGVGGAATIYHNGSAKLATTSTGVQTTGTLNINGAYSFPTSDGTSGQVLQTDGSGNLTFVTGGGGAGDITAVVAGTNLTGGATSGSATVNLATNLTGDLSLTGRVEIGHSVTRPAALNSDSVAQARIGGSDVYLYVASLNASGGYAVALQAARASDFASFNLNLQSNGGALQRAGNTVWDAGNDGSGSGLDADTVDGIQAASFLRSDTIDSVGTDVYHNYGPNSNWSSTLRIGGNGYTAGQNNALASVVTTNGNLHLDSGGNRGIYLNHYSGTAGVAFGSGASGAVAWMGPDGDLWKGSADNSGSKYWHAGNDGAASGLDADLLDGIDSASFLRSDASDNFGSTSSNQTINYYCNSGQYIASAGSSTRFPIQIFGPTANGGDAALVFHIGGDYAGFFGLAADINDLAWGGWSVGSTTKHRIWHQGNDGSGSGLDADLLDGQQGSYYMPTTGMATNLDTYINLRVVRNSGSSAGSDGMYIGYGNAGSGRTRIYGGGSTSAHVYHDGSNFHFASTGLGSVSMVGTLTITNNSIRSASTSAWDGNPGAQGKIQYHSNRWYIVADSASNRIVQFRRNSTDVSYIDNSGNFVGTATNATNATNITASGTLNNQVDLNVKGAFVGPTSGQNAENGGNYQFGYQFVGAWSHPYPDLVLGYHTGLRLGGYINYGGTRFYSDHPHRTTSILFSVGNGDSHVRATNNIYAYTSDKRLKENFRPIENAVDKVKSINGLIFDWKKDMMEKHDFTPDQEKDDAGLIAQEVQKIMPAAIRRAPFDHDLTAPNQSKSGEEFLTVQYEKMVPLLVEAIKEQQKQIDELKKLLEEKE